EPVRIERVGLDLHLVVGEVDAQLPARHDDALVDALAPGAKLARDVLFARNALLGEVRVELKRQPAHGRLGSIGMLLAVEGQRPLQLALPDEAPGSNDVGHDIDLQALFAHGIAQERWLVARYSLLVTSFPPES